MISQQDDERPDRAEAGDKAATPGEAAPEDRPPAAGPADDPAAEAAEAAAADMAADTAAPPADADAAGDGETDAMAALAAEAADLRDRLLRAVAETENLRRRTDRERDDLRKYAIADFARDLLGVADNMRRALDSVAAEARDDNPALASLLEGVELTERELLNTLEKHGVRPVDPVGEKLDPNLHQAMTQIEDDSAAPGTVVQVMQTGYTIHDRLLRAAMVVVAKAKAADPADKAAAGGKVDTQA